MTKSQYNDPPEIRKKIWVALSDLYLDTELSRTDFDWISGTFSQSGYSILELKEIDMFEVFPLLQPNLLDPAGVWAGFNEEWLIPRCTRYYHKRNNFFHRLKCQWKNFQHQWMRKDYWNEIEKRMAAQK